MLESGQLPSGRSVVHASVEGFLDGYSDHLNHREVRF